jgi:hypothetical protein
MTITRDLKRLVPSEKRATTEKEAGEAPKVEESSVAAKLEVADGITILLPVPDQPVAKKGNKARVRVLLVHPTIYIEEEEKERRKNGGQ